MSTASTPIINDFWTHFKSLEKLADSASLDMKVLFTLFSQLKKAYENFGEALRYLGENFHKEISKHYNSDERDFSYYQYLGNYLLKVSQTNKEFSKKIDGMILAPYQDFTQTLDTSNHEPLERVYKNLLKIESSRSSQKKHQDTYYKLSRTADKIQESFGKLIDENNSEELLLKAQEKMIKIKMEAQESGQLYRQNLATTNTLWKKLYTDYRQAFKIFDENEDSKTYYNRNTIIRVIKLLDEFYVKGEGQEPENPEQKFKELDQKEIEKPDTFKVITMGQLDEALKNQTEDEYLSYEAKRKIDEANVLKLMEDEEYSVISGVADETDLRAIQEYTRIFQIKGSKVDEANTASFISAALTTDRSESSISEDSKEQTDSAVVASKPKVSEEEKAKIVALIAKGPNRKFLIDTLLKQRDPNKDLFEIKLPTKVYDHLQDLLVKVLKELIKHDDYENLTSFLPLVNKYYTIKDGQQIFLYRYFRTLSLWEDPLLWSNIMKRFQSKKTNEENQKQRKYEELDNSYLQSHTINKLWGYGKKLAAAALDIAKKPVMSETEAYISVLHELAYYLSRLTKNILVASELLMRLGFEVGIEKEEIADLVQTQKREIDELVRERINTYSITKANKAQVKWQNLFPIYLSLDYLDMSDLVKLISLDKESRKMFRKKIYRTIFYNFGDTMSSTRRFKIWWSMLEIQSLKLNYKELAKEYGEMPADKSLRSIEEVIQIDVIRSFNKHANCDQNLLQELLKGYAAYDKEISYCQGMNYMMGFLYINTQDPEGAFKAFVQIMDKFMKGIFDNEFKLLKLYFFKFQRVLDLYLPDLSQHFKREKVDASYFIPSWFITAFANSFQYSLKSQLLEKIWDFFLIDGLKVMFKVSLLIMIEYREEMLDMKFDRILHFLSDLCKEELFTNEKYWKIMKGEIPVEEAKKEYEFIRNFESKMKNTHLTRQLLKTFDKDYEVLEIRIGKLLNLNKKR